MLELVILTSSVAINLGLVLTVLAKDVRSATSRLFAALTLLLAIEPVVNYVSLHNAHPLLFIRLVMFSVVCMGLTFRWLAAVFPYPHFKLTYPRLAEGLMGLLVALIALSPWMFSGVVISSSGNISPTPASGLVLFVIYFVYTIGGGLWILNRRAVHAKGYLKAQLHYVMLGAAAAFGMAFIANFVLAILFKMSALVVLTPLYLSAFAVAIATAIIRHRLFNLRLIIARTIAYVLLLATLAVFYGVFIFTLSRYLLPSVVASSSQQLLYTSAAILMAFTFQPLRRFFEHYTDRVFYRDLYDSQVVLNGFTQILVSEMDLNKILQLSLRRICEDLHVAVAQVVVMDAGKIYRVEHYGPLPDRLLVPPRLAKLNNAMLVADELAGGERKQLMEEHGIRLSARLKTREEQIGYLLLGDKLSGGIYTSQDIELLKIIAGELAVAIQNAKAYVEIEAFNLTLQERINHATSRLRVANRHLKELDRAKDEFISMASHQLRTPLTTIEGYLSMVLEGDAGDINPTQREYMNYAFDSSKRMVSLISDLLNVSRMSAGRFMIETKPTDMVAVVADEVRQLQSHAQARHLQLIFKPPKSALPLVEIDENKTRQVIMNFIDNAIYYTTNGSVTVNLAQKDGLVCLEVKDTGIGVPQAARAKLFTKFFRADNAQTVRPDGTGLGLYLAKRVIEDQGGTIIFESSEGHGSTFGFCLPIRVTATNKKETSAH